MCVSVHSVFIPCSYTRVHPFGGRTEPGVENANFWHRGIFSEAFSEKILVGLTELTVVISDNIRCRGISSPQLTALLFVLANGANAEIASTQPPAQKVFHYSTIPLKEVGCWFFLSVVCYSANSGTLWA